MKKEPRRKWGIPSVGSGNASVVNDSLTRCGSILFRRKKKRPSEERKIRPGSSLATSCLCLRYRSTNDLSLQFSFSPFSNPFSPSCIVFSPSRCAVKKFTHISLSVAHHLKYSALFSPQLPLARRKSRCILEYIPRKGVGDRDREMGDCREKRLRNIFERRHSCSSRGELLSRTVSDEKIRIINAERAREVQ